jgi:hypothetical protein
LGAAGLSASLLAAALIALPGTDVKVNGELSGTVQNEVRITQNLTDAQNFVVAYNDGANPSVPSSLGVSFQPDGGATWADVQLAQPTHPALGTTLNVIFDPGVASDSQGNIYALYIATVNAVALRAASSSSGPPTKARHGRHRGRTRLSLTRISPRSPRAAPTRVIDSMIAVT